METDKKIISYKKLAKIIPQIRKGKKVVAVTGTYDILHGGHLLFLDYAKRQGDILVVGVGTDRVAKIFKGEGRPIFPELLRARFLAALEIIDFVVLVDEDVVDKISGRNFINTLHPDVWVVPYKDHNPEGIKKLAKELGIKLIRNPRIKPNRINFPLSTTYIIDTLKSRPKRQ